MLISADARPGAGAPQMDAREAQTQLQQAHELHRSLADTAQKQHAFVGAALDKESHERPEAALARAIESLARTVNGAGSMESGGAGAAPAFGRPDLVASAPAGIAVLTPQDVHACADAVTIGGGVDVSATVGRNLAVAVKNGISLFTHGDADTQRKEHGDKGVKLHAAHGKVDVQAQSGELKAAADKDVNVASTHAKVEVAAKEHVLLTAGGAYVKIGSGNIEIHAPGSVQFKASMKELGGPASLAAELVSLPKGKLIIDPDAPLFSQQIDFSHLAMNEEPGFNSAGKAYWVVKEDGTFLTSGTTSNDGLTERIFANQAGPIKVAIEAGEWQVEEYFEDDDDDRFAEEQST